MVVGGPHVEHGRRSAEQELQHGELGGSSQTVGIVRRDDAQPGRVHDPRVRGERGEIAADRLDDAVAHEHIAGGFLPLRTSAENPRGPLQSDDAHTGSGS